MAGSLLARIAWRSLTAGWLLLVSSATNAGLIEGADQVLALDNEGIARAYDRFGASVAAQGDTLLVGAPGAASKGKVAVFVRQAGGGWAQQAELAPASDVTRKFGTRVAIDGDLAAIQAPGIKSEVYLYRRTGTEWAQEATLLSPVDSSISSFGVTLSVSGNAVMVGDPALKTAYVFRQKPEGWVRDEAENLRTGTGSFYVRAQKVQLSGDRAWVAGRTGVSYNRNTRLYSESSGCEQYHWNGSTWVPERIMPVANLSSSQTVDASVQSMVLNLQHQILFVVTQKTVCAYDLDGNLLFELQPPSASGIGNLAQAGTDGDHLWVAGANASGSSKALGFKRNTAGTWVPGSPLTFSTGVSGVLIGTTAGELVAGLPDATGRSGILVGHAEVHTWNAGSNAWNLAQTLGFDDQGPSFAQFGASTALNDSWLVVGSPWNMVANGWHPGAVSVYAKNTEGVWTLNATLKADDGAVKDALGRAVAVLDSTVFAGAPGSDLSAQQQAGAVYVFQRGTDGWTQTQKLVLPPELAAADFGQSLDVSNGTLLAGGEGVVAVFVRNGSTWQQQGVLACPAAAEGSRAFGSQVSASEGWAVVPCSDFNTVFVYRQNSDGWKLHSTLKTATKGALFGMQARVCKGLLVVSGAVVARMEPVEGGAPNPVMETAVWCYKLSGSAWKFSTLLRNHRLAEGFDVHLGNRIATDGTNVAVASEMVVPSPYGGAASVIHAVDLYNAQFKHVSTATSGILQARLWSFEEASLLLRGAAVIHGMPDHVQATMLDAGAVAVLNLGGFEVRHGAFASSPLLPSGGELPFGMVLTGQPQKRVLRIKNTGAVTLRDVTLALAGPDARDFSLRLPASTTLAVGAVTTVEIELRASTSTDVKAVLDIRSSSAPGRDLQFNLTALNLASPVVPAISASEGIEQSVELGSGSESTFRVVATGTEPLRYQWLRNGVPIPGATESQHFLPLVQSPGDAGAYQVRVTNAYGSTLSRVWKINVYRSVNKTLNRGRGPLTLTGEAWGPGPYAWTSNSAGELSNSAFIAGATTPRLQIKNPEDDTLTLKVGGQTAAVFAVDVPDKPYNAVSYYESSGLTFRLGQPVRWFVGTHGQELTGLSARNLPPGLRIERERVSNYGDPYWAWVVVGVPSQTGYFVSVFTSSMNGVASDTSTIPIQVFPKLLTEAQAAKSFEEWVLNVGVEVDIPVHSLPTNLDWDKPFSVSGLPPGLRLAKIQRADEWVPSWRITGTPTAPTFQIAKFSGWSAINEQRETWLQPITVKPMPLGSTGSYSGLIDTCELLPEGGAVRLTATSAGTFSATVTLGARTCRMQGHFSLPGSIANSSVLGVVPLPVKIGDTVLRLVVEVRSGGVLTGTVQGAHVVDGEDLSYDNLCAVFGERLHSSSHPVPAAAVGTFLFSANRTDTTSSGFATARIAASQPSPGGGWSGGAVIIGASTQLLASPKAARQPHAAKHSQTAADDLENAPLPRGQAFGQCVVTSSGGAIISGRMPDGSMMVAASALTLSETLMVHVPSQERLNGLHGGIQYFLDSSYAYSTGTLLWTRRPGASEGWPLGFVCSLELSAERKLPAPPGHNVLGDLRFEPSSAYLMLGDRRLPVMLDASNQFRLAPDAASYLYNEVIEKLDLKLNPLTRQFSGTLVWHSNIGQTAESTTEWRCQGQFDSWGTAAGFALGPNDLCERMSISKSPY